MKGSTFKRCGCTELVDGRRKQLGAQCPKLRRADGAWNPRHGSWSYQLSRKVRGGFATQADAQQALDAARERVRRGVSIEDTRTDAYLREWIETKHDIKATTHSAYTLHLKKHLIPKIGHVRLSELRVAHVAEALLAVPGSDANRQRVRATLRSALTDAVREGLILTNVAALVKLPSGRRPKALVWTPERVEQWSEARARLRATDAQGRELDELKAAARPPSPAMVWRPDQLGEFLDHADGNRLYALYHVVAHCGLRRGEVCGLRWVDVDLDRARLTVSKQLVVLSWEPIEDDPKSDAGGRTVALDAGTVAVLRAHRKAQLEERMQWGSAWVDSGRVFTREDGSAVHPEWVADQFGALAAGAGLPPIRFHDLRHGAASLMLAAGVPMKVVSETLGHSSLGITADTYSSVFSEVAAAAAEATAALVPRGPRRVRKSSQ